MRRLLAAAYPVLRIGNGLVERAGLKRSGRLRVLIYHDVAPSRMESFEAQLRWLSKRWRFVDPLHFTRMISGLEPVQGNNLLLTFDDGFASNRIVASEILGPMGIRALFFVVSEFVQLSRDIDQRDFISQHFFPGMSSKAVSEHHRNMTFDDLEFLLQSGHIIGAHTTSHRRLSEVKQPRALEAEIVESADFLEQKLNFHIDHFAYTYGDLASFSKTALEVARRRFKYIYTGLRGDNSRSIVPWAIRRDAVGPEYSPAFLGSLLEGGADLKYLSDLNRYEHWGA